MKYSIPVLILFTCLFYPAASQEVKPRFSPILQGGALIGGSFNSWGLQVVNGVAYKTWFAGIGIGTDQYYYRSIPVFLDLRKNILDRKNTPFVYFDIGTNPPLDRSDSTPWEKNNYSGGLYLDMGIGYSWNLEGNAQLLLSLGYSRKQIIENRTYVWAMDDVRDRYHYTFRRVFFKLGFSF